MHKRLSDFEEGYKPMSDGYGMIGDAIYEAGWWDRTATGFYKGSLPRTLGEFLKHVHNKEKVEEWFIKYPLNLIVCETYGANDAMSMIRFYQEITSPETKNISEDKDAVNDKHHVIHIGSHGFRIYRSDDLLNSPLKFLNVWEFYPLDHFGKMDEERKFTRKASWPDNKQTMTDQIDPKHFLIM